MSSIRKSGTEEEYKERETLIEEVSDLEMKWRKGERKRSCESAEENRSKTAHHAVGTSSVSLLSCVHLSVEQMEVTRRLRNSGATLQQITEAYETFDKLDRELGSFGLKQDTQTLDAHVDRTLSASSQASFYQNSVLETQKRRDGGDVASKTQSNTLFDRTDSNTNNIQNQPATSVFSCMNNRSYNGDRSAEKSTSSSKSLFLSFHSDSQSSSSSVLGQECDSNADHIQMSDAKTCVRNLSTVNHNPRRTDTSHSMSLPEGVLREASRCFLSSASKDVIVDLIHKYSMTSPTFDAWLLTKQLGISHEEVETFLRGEISDMENANQAVVTDWFIDLLFEADWFIEEVTHYLQNFTSQKPSELIDVDLTPRRERFTFHEAHLVVLESHFKRNPYPVPNVRKMIAHECNIKMAIHSGMELSERERVSQGNVDNWFRNRRKDIPRKSKIETQLSSNAKLISRTHQMDSILTNRNKNLHNAYSTPLTNDRFTSAPIDQELLDGNGLRTSHQGASLGGDSHNNSQNTFAGSSLPSQSQNDFTSSEEFSQPMLEPDSSGQNFSSSLSLNESGKDLCMYTVTTVKEEPLNL